MIPAVPARALREEDAGGARAAAWSAAGAARVRALFDRLSEDEAFRFTLLRAEDDGACRRLLSAAGYQGFSLADVRAHVSRALHEGQPLVSHEPAWRPGPDETWADAPATVRWARRRAIVFGALAASGCADLGGEPLCRPLPVKLSFVVAGAIKGGTTALHYFLGEHPDICTAAQKETHFFVRDVFFRAGRPKYEWLDFSFQHHRGERVLGESTPEYMYFRKAGARMCAYNPELKLILLLRDPADRAYSQYRMLVARGLEDRPFAAVVRDDLAADGGQEGTYTAGGFYLRYIRALLERFPRRQILFLRSEDLRNRHLETLRTTYSFLGVDPDFAPDRRMLLTGPGPPLPAADRRTLVDLYVDEVRALEEFLGWELAEWRR